MNTSTLLTRVPPETKDAIALLAGEHDRSVSGEVRHALGVWVRAHGADLPSPVEPDTRAPGGTPAGAVELATAARTEAA